VTWTPGGEFQGHTFTRQALAFVSDFAEVNPWGDSSGNWMGAVEWVSKVCAALGALPPAGHVECASAVGHPLPNDSADALITDPPYYDNVPYSDISDYFFVWLKQVVAPIYPEHFAATLSPKKSEITALSSKHEGSMVRANQDYETRMAISFRQAANVLKPRAPLVVVYAHKTTLGWATLIDALRQAGFVVTEAWPIDTEKTGRLLAQDTSALASSIFLVALAFWQWCSSVRPGLIAPLIWLCLVSAYCHLFGARVNTSRRS